MRFVNPRKFDPAHCLLCPRMCGADRTAEKDISSGYCGMSREMRIARIAPHLWEEPCISGTKGSGTIFFVGCHEGCVYCQNRTIAHVRGCDRLPGKMFSPKELSVQMLRLQEEGVHNINLVTPTHFVPRIVETLALAKKNGLQIPVVYNTGGYERVETLRLLDGLVDIYLTDFQHALEDAAALYASAPDYGEYASEALREMLRQTGSARFSQGMDAAAYNAFCAARETEADYDAPLMERGVIVRHLLLPGNEADSRAVLRLIHSITSDAEREGFFLSLMNQYTPMLPAHLRAQFPALFSTVSNATYDALLEDALTLGFENIFFQYADTASESFIPVWGEGV